MSQNDDRCPTGKRCYVTREGAKRSARAGLSKGLGKMSAYPCDWCANFHVGHATMARKVAVREWRRAV